jgi:hypothetical protein
MTATTISISRAIESDLPTMVALRCGTLEEDILNRFLLDYRQAEAIRKETKSLTASLGKRFTHPTNRCYIYKAVDMQTGEMVGWTLVRWEDSNSIYAPLDNNSDRLDLLSHYMREVRKKWYNITAEKPHVGKSRALSFWIITSDQCISARGPICKNRSTQTRDWKAAGRLPLLDLQLGQRARYCSDEGHLGGLL